MVGKKNIICSVCKRHFATQAALAQHRTASHPQGAQQSMRGKPRRKTGRAAQANGIRKNVSFGSDLLGQLGVPSRMAPGRVLVHTALCPLALSTGRLGEEGALWTRWRPLKMKVRVQCAGASTTFGSVILGWTADSTPDFGASSGLQAMRRVATFKPQVAVRLNGSGTINVPCETSRKWLQTTGDVDQTAQGDIAVIVSAETGGYQGNVTMTLFLDWEVEFEGPTLGISTGPGDQSIGPDAGWTNLFTTSDGSFDADRLTMKMHHGGGMCPFSAAQPGVVYAPAATVKVPYVTENGSSSAVTHFAKVQGYGTPGLLCFTAYADARAYITTGDITKAIPYKAAGAEITPAIPRFKPVSGETASCDTVLESKVNQLAELVEQLLSGTAPVSTVNDPQALRRIRAVEDTIKQVTTPLQVSLDRGTIGTPFVTFTEDPVRSMVEKISRMREELSALETEYAESQSQGSRVSPYEEIEDEQRST